MMQGSTAQNYPEFDDPVEEEAARFLFSDFTSQKGHNTSEEDHLHAGPVIRGISDESRLHTWIEMAKDNPSRVAKADRDSLRQRLRELSVDQAVEFQAATEIDSPSVESESAVADGGAVVKESTADVESDDKRELSPDQEWAEYEDDAELASEKNSMRGFVFSDTYDTVEEALDEEFDRDVVRRHVVELLDERLEVLGGERDEWCRTTESRVS